MKKTVFFAAVSVLAAAFLILLCKINKEQSARVISEDEIQAYLLENGWETDPERFVFQSVTVPFEFNKEYTAYNTLQKEQGFDLSEYRGGKAVLVTCPVINYCGDDSVYAELILSDSELIGAALVSDRYDGFLKPLNKH